MIQITINNNVCEMAGQRQECDKLYKAMKVRNPNAFHLRRYMKPGWDGKADLIKDTGKFDTGLLERVVAKAKELEIKIRLIDNRPDITKDAKLRTVMKDGKELRDYQLDSVKAVVEHNIGGILHPRCTLKVATHGGKTIISAGIYNAYRVPTIFIMNSQELFRDALRDIPKMLNCPVGYVGNGKVVMGKFMICMVKSLENKMHLPELKKWLATCQVGIWDECDLAGNKTNKNVIKKGLYNCIVRIGLSGTVNASPLKKDLLKNLNIEALFGMQAHQITNRELIDKGISSEVEVEFLEGNTIKQQALSYAQEYEDLIVKNKDRNKKIIQRIKWQLANGNNYQLIILQRHEHIKRVFRRLEKADLGVVIDWVHHSRKDRFRVVDNFMEGKINILIGSMILKRGKNFHQMNYMMNAGGGKSPENILQLLGRAFRGCKVFEDLWDEGQYLKPHSRKRDIYYRNEKLKVINNYKTIKKKK